MKKIIFIFIFVFNSGGIIFTFSQTVTFVPTGAETIYDLVPPGSPTLICQYVENPDNIHCALVCSSPGDIWGTFPGKRVKYYLSFDRGISWSYIVSLPTELNYPELKLLSDGSCVISVNKTVNGIFRRGIFYADAFPGLGSFTPLPIDTSTLYIRFTTTQSLNLNNKIVFLSTKRYPSAVDSVKKSFLTSVTMPPTNLMWSNVQAEPNGLYCISKSINGKIGIVYKGRTNPPTSESSCIFFIESTDNGISFNSPLKIFEPKFTGINADSLVPGDGISMTYQGETPGITFDAVKKNNAGIVIPNEIAKIYFWSNELPGTDPNRCKNIADTTNVPFPGDLLTRTDKDGYGFLSRPVIGSSLTSDPYSAFFYVIFQVKTGMKGGKTDTSNFKALYFIRSYSNPSNWRTPYRITPETPLKDWSYPSISPMNYISPSYQTGYCYITALSDSVPGTYINSQANGESIAKQYFIKLSFYYTILPGVNKIGTEVPDKFSLYQNYPNPFNPVTNIRFSIPPLNPPLVKVGSGVVTLKVYDIAGREIQTLINEKLNPGTYEVTFDGNIYASGVYFYQLRSGEFIETKKLVLLK